MTRVLFSIPVVCDGGMEVTFRKKYVVVKYQNKLVLTGIRGIETSPWLIPIVEKIEPHAAVKNNYRWNKKQTCK